MTPGASAEPGGNIEIILDTPAGITPGELPTFGGLEVVTGEVRVAPGEFPEQGRIEIWVRQQPPAKPYARGVLCDFPATYINDSSVGNAESFPFALSLPNRPSGQHDWLVAARLVNYLGDRGPTAVRRIALLPSAPVRGLMACLFTLGDFVLVSEMAQEGILSDVTPRRIIYNFAPPAELLDQIEGVRIEVSEILLPPDGDGLKGRFIIDLKERRWTDYLQDKCRWMRRPFEFPATTLAVCAPGGGGNLHTPATVMPPYPELVGAVRELLRPFL